MRNSHFVPIVWMMLPLAIWADWPQLRGPHHDGSAEATPLAESWPAEGPPVLWMRSLGQGYSSFAVVADRAYTQIQNVYGQYLVCLDTATGKTIWEYRYELPYEPTSIYPGPRSTPTVADQRIYFVSPDAIVYCLALDGRTLHWSVDLRDRFQLRGLGFGYAASPIVEQGKVILPVGGPSSSLVALDAMTGETAWTAGDKLASYATPLPITFADRRYVIAFLQNALICVDIATGKLQWEKSYSQGYDEHSAFPLYSEPLLMVASPFRGGAMAYRMTSTDATIGAEVAWQTPKLSNDVASSLVVDGFIYGFDLRDAQSKAQRPSRGEFRCLDWQTGRVQWSSDVPGHANVTAADGKLVLFNDRGELLLLKQNPERYEELGRVSLFGDEICWTTPALSDGRLFLRTQKWAACVYLGRPDSLTTTQQQSARPASQVARGPALFDATLLLQGEREHPFVRPDLPELTLWYVACLLGVLLPAMLQAAAVALVCRRLPDSGATARITFWLSMAVFGMAATPIANRHWPEFIFTWPATLFACYQSTMLLIVPFDRLHRALKREPQSSPPADLRRLRWQARLAGLCLIGVCVVFLLLCRRLSLAHEITFLFGFLPAFPVAAFAAWRIHRQRKLWSDVVWGLLSFTAYFWASGGLLFVRNVLDELIG